MSLPLLHFAILPCNGRLAIGVPSPTPHPHTPRHPQTYPAPLLRVSTYRSYKAVVTFYSALVNLAKTHRQPNNFYYASKPLLLPGLATLPDDFPEQKRTGKSPNEMASLLNTAIGAIGKAFMVKSPANGGSSGVGSNGGGGGYYGSGGGSPGKPADSGGSGGGGGMAAAMANAAAVARRLWQPPPLVANLLPPLKDSPVLVRVGCALLEEATEM